MLLGVGNLVDEVINGLLVDKARLASEATSEWVLDSGRLTSSDASSGRTSLGTITYAGELNGAVPSCEVDVDATAGCGFELFISIELNCVVSFVSSAKATLIRHK